MLDAIATAWPHFITLSEEEVISEERLVCSASRLTLILRSLQRWQPALDFLWLLRGGMTMNVWLWNRTWTTCAHVAARAVQAEKRRAGQREL